MKSARKSNFTTGFLALVSLGSVLTLLMLYERWGFNVLSYPYYFPDSFDWLANGLRYAHPLENFDISHRALFLPLVTAQLFALGLEDLIVHFGTFFYFANVVFLAYFLGQLIDSAVAFLTTLFFAASYFLQGQSAFLGADVAALFFLNGLVLTTILYRTTGREYFLLLASLFLGLGIHTQYIQLVFLPLLTFLFRPAFSLATTVRAIAVFLIAALPLFLPRFAEFGFVYREGVQHVSLLGFDPQGISYYVQALPMAFSWPVVGLCVAGLAIGISREPMRFLSISFFLWIVNHLIFFGVFYSWYDARFLIYILLPIAFFCAVSLVELSKMLLRYLPSFVAKPIYVAVCAFALYFATSPPTPYPFDPSFAVTPLSYVQQSDDNWQLRDGRSLPYLIEHWSESNHHRELQAVSSFDGVRLSLPLIGLANKLRIELVRSELKSRVFYYEDLDPIFHYVVDNRNKLYLRSKIKFLPHSALIRPELERGPIILVCRTGEAANLLREIGRNVRQKSIVKNKAYEALELEAIPS